MLINEIRVLVKKEIQMEWRQKYAIHGLLLYLASTIFVCYLSFKAKQQAINPITWNTLFWLIILFMAVNAIGKSFTQESKQRNIFYYSIVSPEAVIYSKIFYNALVMIGISFVGILFYSWVMGNPVGNLPLYLISLLLGSIGFSAGAEWNFVGTTTLVPEIGFFYGLTPMHYRFSENNYTLYDGSGTYFYTKSKQNQLLLKISILF